MRLLPAAALLILSSACVKEISSEERLERELSGTSDRAALSGEELAKVNCNDISAELDRAHNENRPETDRMVAYIELYESLQKKVNTFEEAMTRNPDLVYQEGSQQLVQARDVCVNQLAEVRRDFERLTREIAEVATLQELRGGSTVTVARMDFNTLRQAINTLNPDDKDTLLNRIAAQEKRVEVEKPASKRGK